MRAMWAEALPRLRGRGLGRPIAVRTVRLAGIGESQVADQLGEAFLRTANPVVATYARSDAVDVRISAEGPPNLPADAQRRAADELADAAEARVIAALGRHVWARGATTWAHEIGGALAAGWTVALVEYGTGGSTATLLGDVDWLLVAERYAAPVSRIEDLERSARRARDGAGAQVGLAVSARPRGNDTAVSVVVVTPAGTHRERRLVFLRDTQGRARAALAAADVLLAAIRGGGAERQRTPALLPGESSGTA
jgi:hypothetical protein